jgi:hypothetical protein
MHKILGLCFLFFANSLHAQLPEHSLLWHLPQPDSLTLLLKETPAPAFQLPEHEESLRLHITEFQNLSPSDVFVVFTPENFLNPHRLMGNQWVYRFKLGRRTLTTKYVYDLGGNLTSSQINLLFSK